MNLSRIKIAMILNQYKFTPAPGSLYDYIPQAINLGASKLPYSNVIFPVAESLIDKAHRPSQVEEGLMDYRQRNYLLKNPQMPLQTIQG